LKKHYDKLDDLEELFDDAYDDLNNPEFVRLLNMLKSANIDYEQALEITMNKIITECIGEFALDKDPSTKAIPILDFVAAFLNNFFGFTTGYIRDYMLEHAEQWDNLVELYIDEINIPIIERRH
jgi:hypothetical protein